MSTDLELLDAWRGGNDDAAQQLLDRYLRRLYAFFRNKVDTGLEDLIQRTVLGCLEARHRLREGSNFRAFLFTVARNELYDHYTRHRRDTKMIDWGTMSVEDIGPSPSHVVAEHDEQRLLLHALRLIPLDYQIALELYYWEDMTGPELAEVLDVPEATVRSRIRRGQEQLRKRMAELADSPEQLESTFTDLDKWAKSIRKNLEPAD